MSVDEERVIIGVVLKSNVGGIVSATLVPSTRRLLQTMEKFSQVAQIIWVIRITKTQWLMHIDNFMKITV